VTLVGGQITERFISGQMVDVAGIEPATPCLQSRRKFNLSRCFGCAYQFQAVLRLLQSCSKRDSLTPEPVVGPQSGARANSSQAGDFAPGPDPIVAHRLYAASLVTGCLNSGLQGFFSCSCVIVTFFRSMVLPRSSAIILVIAAMSATPLEGLLY
jgi:hypothetical protein